MKEIKVIFTVTICLIATFCSFMYVYSKTLQRSADDLVKIRTSDRSLEIICNAKGGNVVWDSTVVDGKKCDK